MKILRNKPKAFAATLVLVLTFSAILVALPAVTAHDPAWLDRPTYCYVAPAPPTVGVVQPMLIQFWLNVVPPTAAGAFGDRWNFYVDVTDPNGNMETLGPFKSDPVGGGYTWYTPTQVGTYKVVSRFPGQTITGIPNREDNINVNDTFAASSSKPAYFTVQEEPLPRYVETPFPEDYWTRPVYDANRGWGDTVMGQWLGGAYYEELRENGIPYTTGPESSHILWTRSYWSGGIMGGFGDVGYYNGIAYEGFGSPKLVVDGKAYYPVQTPPRGGWYCIDLYTGETLYYENNTDGTKAMPEFGEVLNFQTPNQFGGFSYLWRTSGLGTNTWEMLDGFSGKGICQIENVPSWTRGSRFNPGGYQFHDAIGGVCYLNFVNLGTTSSSNYYLQIWNTTEAVWWRPQYGVSPPKTLINGSTNIPPTSTSNDYWYWRPGAENVGMSTSGYTTYDGNNGFSMNVSVESTMGASIQEVKPQEFVIVGTGGQNDARGVTQGFLKAYSLKSPDWGEVLWETTFTPPKATTDYPNSTNGGSLSFGGVDSESGVFSFTERVTGKIWVYSLETGQPLWDFEISSPWYYYGTSITFHKGKAYTMGTTGVVECFNATTGEFYWNWTAPSIGYLEEEGLQYTPVSLAFFVDDQVTGREKVYFHGSTGWAGQTSPIRRDGSIFCLDTNTGEMIWRLMAYPSYANNGLSRVIISEGRIIYLDNHDNQIYCLGKGPSGTTVSASPEVSVHGQSVLIKGTVTDQTTTGRLNVAGSLDFSLKGTPAIADESMEVWMEYLYHQRPIPEDAKGVTVKLTAIDPNGNYQDIGEVTSDMWGNFGKSWNPPVPGEYFVLAEFEGSAAYGSSSASTYFVVDEAPSPGAPIEPEPATPAPTTPAPTTPAPTTPEPTTPEPTTTAPTTPAPTTPEPTEPTEAPFITTEIAIIAVVAVACVIGIVSYWALRKRK